MNIKKIIAMVSALCLTATALFGCGDQKSAKKYGLDPKKPTTVTIWHYYNGVQQENFDDAIIEFNETVGREQGIVVEAYSKGSIDELSDSVLASVKQNAGAEDMPDMFAAYSETAYAVDKLGGAVDLSEYFTNEELSEYVDGYIEEGRISSDGGLKIFPTAKSTEVMMLNLTDWEKFSSAEGVSTDDLTTWEGVVDTAEKYYEYTDNLTPDIENDGKAFFGRDSVANYMLVGAKQLGAEFVTNKDEKFVLNIDKTAVRRLWENYYVPYVKGYFTAQSRYRSDDAKIGQIIALICSTTGSAYFPDSITIDDDYSYPIESLVMPVPNFEGTDPYLVQQGAGMVVTKSDEKTEYACTVFLKWFTEKERNVSFSIGSGYMPVKKDANDEKLITADEVGAENQMLIGALKVAIDEIKTYNLYTAKPFDNTAETRNFIGDYIQNTAQDSFNEADSRIADGEDREKVLEDYVSDEAFEEWYEEFSAGLRTASGLE
ncbi:MAG: extracellular solute-binding protein [Ruminococcus flavefaciens]|nr:extracellular solute-binding protein [Ruminococcus flavefaciens]